MNTEKFNRRTKCKLYGMAVQDLVYQRLKAFKTFSNDDSLASLVHEWSTQKAETMLVEAVNRQKDIIFDGAPLYPARAQPIP